MILTRVDIAGHLPNSTVTIERTPTGTEVRTSGFGPQPTFEFKVDGANLSIDEGNKAVNAIACLVYGSRRGLPAATNSMVYDVKDIFSRLV